MFPDDLSFLPAGEGWDGAIIFSGRLAKYKYYDMTSIIERVLGLAEL